MPKSKPGTDTRGICIPVTCSIRRTIAISSGAMNVYASPVAAELGNTPAVCRASYVHPLVIARYLDEGTTIAPFMAPARTRTTARRRAPAGGGSHAPEEYALIRFLDKYFPERRRHRRDRRRRERERAEDRRDLRAA